MIEFRNMTIKKKLTVVMMVASAVVVTLSCLIFVGSSFWLSRKNHVDKDLVLLRLTGRNSQAALMFDVPEDAEKLLASLEADSSIVFACIYTPDGKPFAVYQRKGSGPEIEPPAMRDEGYEYSGGYLKMFNDIWFDGKKIGSIYLQDDQADVYASFQWDMATLIIVMLITLASAYLIANKLQGVISRPILSLTETAEAISRTEDYSIRAERHGSDEIGVLIDSFNSMFNEIQKREEAIAASEAKFRSIVETTSDWIWEIDAAGRYVYSSPKIKDLLGYDLEEVLGRTPFDFMLPEESKRMEVHLTGLLRGSESLEGMENINIHKDGRLVILETSAVPIIDVDGECCGYRGIDRDITERKRAEEKVAESSAMLQMVMNNIPQFIFWKDRDSIYTGCNQNFACAAGYDTPEELIGKTDYDMPWKKEEADFFRSCDERVMSSDKGEYHIIESQLRADGTNRWVDTNKVPLHDSEGRVIGILGTYEDITALRLSQEELKRSEAFLNATGQMAKVGGWELDVETNKVRWTEGLCRIAEVPIGYQPTLDKALNFFHPDDRPAINDAIGRAIDFGEPYNLELRFKTAGGRDIWVHTVCQPHVEDGVTVSLSGTMQDISERKVAAEALRLDEARLQVLVELNQMIDVTEKELADFALEQAIKLTKSKIGYIAFMSEDETILNMYSWSRSAMAECMIRKKPLVYPVVDTGLWGEAVRQRKPIITNNYQGPEPLKRGCPEGHIKIKRHMNIPVFDGRKIVAVAGVANKEDAYNDPDVRQLTLLMDGMWQIIRRNKTDQEREDLLRTLASKNEELESIVYTASHDLRSPLVNIDGFSSELASSCQEVTETLTHTQLPDTIEQSLLTILNEDIPVSLKYIRTSATKMDMLMRGLLKMSRLGREATEMEPLDMNELIENVSLGMQHQIQKQKVELTIDSLPPCLGDKSQISQVFTNLLDNAIKYLDPAKKGKIRISGTSQDGESVYSVKDNGVGIDQECHHKIFEIFHRLDPEGLVRGEGIGLTIVKRIIDRHNGRIWVESSVGVGTTFYVALRNSV